MDRYGTSSVGNAVPGNAIVQNAAGVNARIATLRECVDRLGGLGNHADRLANRIAGTQPEGKDSSGGKPMPVPNGLSDELNEIIDAINSRCMHIESALARTEHALGGVAG